MAKIAVIGFGVVGSGVVEVLDKNKNSIANKAGEKIEVKYILDLRDFPNSPYSEKFIKDFSRIPNDEEIEVVVECIGGIKPAFDFVKGCLQAKKSVVSSNKELISNKGAELLQIAKDNGVNLFFEGSVGGGVPIIRPMNQCLAANEITEIAGIVNGTTNFILTKMIREAMDFDTALNLALELGYAEKNDQSADIDGIDACRKICILSSLAFGFHVYPTQVHTEGIRNLKLIDIEFARSAGFVVKLIARAKKLENGKILAAVTPAFILAESQLAGVEDVFNGILVRGDVLGDVVFYGRGAGKLPTASAMVADVIDIIKNRGATNKAIFWQDGKPDQVADFNEDFNRYYIRYEKSSRSGLQPLGHIFGHVEEMVSKEGNSAFLTDLITYGELLSMFDIFEKEGNTINSVIPILNY